jgi:hypothetical protein
MKSTIGGAAALLLLAFAAWPAAVKADQPDELVVAMREPAKTTAHNEKAHVFAAIAGSWTGGGTMEMTGDITEKLRCRANHSFRQNSSSLALNIRCASDNYKFELTSDVVERRGQISGKWSEVTYKASGAISGRVAGNRIVATARSDSLNTEVSLTTTGNRQTIVITPEKTYVIKVQIALARR